MISTGRLISCLVLLAMGVVLAGPQRREAKRAAKGVSLIQAKQTMSKTLVPTTPSASTSVMSLKDLAALFVVSSVTIGFLFRQRPGPTESVKQLQVQVATAAVTEAVPSVAELIGAVLLGDSEACEKMLDTDKRLTNQSDPWGCTPLHVAAHADSETVVRLLLARRASVLSQDAIGDSALHFAARTGSHVCSVLLEARADVDAQNMDGDTPLISAAKAGNDATVEILLDHGASTKGLRDSELPLTLTAALVCRMVLPKVEQDGAVHGAAFTDSDCEAPASEAASIVESSNIYQ